jgi:hypothetical protein
MTDKPDWKRWGRLTPVWILVGLFAAYMAAYYAMRTDTVVWGVVTTVTTAGPKPLILRDYRIASCSLPPRIGAIFMPAESIDEIFTHQKVEWHTDW